MGDSEKKNRWGLSRDIPEPVKRLLRQRCGYGCVYCGNMIIDYEHLDPEFVDAKVHDSNGMTIACPTHHRKKAGKLSKEVLVECNKNPYSIKNGFAIDSHDFGGAALKIYLGQNLFENVETVLRIKGEDILSVCMPEQAGAPYRLSALLRDSIGNPMLQIEQNEWKASTENWDVTSTKNSIQIRSAPGLIVLSVRFKPPAIYFDRIEMTHRDVAISCNLGDKITIKSSGNVFEQTSGGRYIGSLVGLDIDDDDISIGVGGRLTNL